MNIIHENELWPEDEAMFDSIENQTLSPSEKKFFEEMRSKMFDENAPWPETLVWEHDNPDHIYLLRHGYDEFLVGSGLTREEWQNNEVHAMNLSEVLFTNLKDAGILDRDLTLLQWLRENDFKCVRYDHVNDGNKI